MNVTRQRLLSQAELVSMMQSHAECEPDPDWRAYYTGLAKRDAERLENMRHEFASRQRNNVFPLPMRGRVEG